MDVINTARRQTNVNETHTDEVKMPTGAGKLLSWAEHGLYLSVATVLGIAAVVLLGWSVFSFVSSAFAGDVNHAVLQALDSLLLVVMLVEILHTVKISIRSDVLVIEPFMIVGIIAAIRRILVVTAEQAHPTAEKALEFQMAMLELGILTVMILALVGAIFIVRKFSISRTEQEEQPRLDTV